MKLKSFWHYALFLVLLQTLFFASCSISSSGSKSSGIEDEEEIYYTVTYSSEHGTPPGVIKVKADTSLTDEQLPELEADGYTFCGWYIESKKVSVGYVVSKNINLIALWETIVPEIAEYKVRHYLQDIETSTYIEDTELCETLTGTIGNKTEAAAKDITGFTVQEFSQVVIASDGSSVVSIYYDRNTIILTLELDGGSGIATSVSGKYGSSISINTSFLTKDGYAFSEWSPSLPSTFTENSTHTAIWSANTYTLSFNKNNDSATGTMQDMSITYGESVVLTSCTYECSGYHFGGWAISADGNVSYADEATFLIGTSDITLYAVWVENGSHAIVYVNTDGAENENPSSFKETDAITLVSASKTGYEFAGWYTDEDYTQQITGWSAGEKTESITLYAKWKAATVSYTVKYYLQNLNDTASYTEDSALCETLTGITGENTEAAVKEITGFIVQNFNQVTIAADGSTVVSIYYDRNIITLTLDLDGGSGLSLLSGLYGSSVTEPDIPVKDGYTFDSWTPSLPSTFIENGTYTAVWTSAVISATVESISDLEVTTSTSGNIITVSVTDSSSYTDFVWYVNGKVQSDETSSSFAFDMTELDDDVYEIIVVAEKDDSYYSAEVIVKKN